MVNKSDHQEPLPPGASNLSGGWSTNMQAYGYREQTEERSTTSTRNHRLIERITRTMRLSANSRRTRSEGRLKSLATHHADHQPCSAQAAIKTTPATAHKQLQHIYPDKQAHTPKKMRRSQVCRAHASQSSIRGSIPVSCSTSPDLWFGAYF